MTVFVCGLSCQAASAADAPATGPLRRHPTNRRYFCDGTGRAVYLTDTHTWNNQQDFSHPESGGGFDFDGYLDFLERHDHNFIRLWRWDLVAWVWKSFLRGLNPILMDTYRKDVLSSSGDSVPLEEIRQAMGATSRIAAELDLAAMTPRGGLASIRFCLAGQGQHGMEYVIYLPTGRQCELRSGRCEGQFGSGVDRSGERREKHHRPSAGRRQTRILRPESRRRGAVVASGLLGRLRVRSNDTRWDLRVECDVQATKTTDLKVETVRQSTHARTGAGLRKSRLATRVHETWTTWSWNCGTANGKTRVSRVQSPNYAHYMLPVDNDEWDIYPVGAVIRVSCDGKSLGEATIPRNGLNGLYPDGRLRCFHGMINTTIQVDQPADMNQPEEASAWR